MFEKVEKEVKTHDCLEPAVIRLTLECLQESARQSGCFLLVIYYYIYCGLFVNITANTNISMHHYTHIDEGQSYTFTYKHDVMIVVVVCGSCLCMC